MKAQQNYDLVFLECLKEKTKNRFDKKVSKGTDGECWIWNAAHGKYGHGQFFICTSETPIDGYKRKGLIAAHRAAYMIYKREAISPELEACHRCDNPRCVNPDHIFIGTHADNMRDMSQKGRAVMPEVRGEANQSAKLTEEDVIFIRTVKSSLIELSERFGVAKTTIWEARNGLTWPHLPYAHSAKVKKRNLSRPTWMKRNFASVSQRGLIRRSGMRRNGEHVMEAAS